MRSLDGLGRNRHSSRRVVAAFEREDVLGPTGVPCTSRAAPASISNRSGAAGRGSRGSGAPRSHHPAPMPSSTRPLEIRSTVVAAFARTAGSRNVTGETIVPRRRRSVLARERAEERPGVVRARLLASSRLRGSGRRSAGASSLSRSQARRDREPLRPSHALLALEHQAIAEEPHRRTIPSRWKPPLTPSPARAGKALALGLARSASLPLVARRASGAASVERIPL